MKVTTLRRLYLKQLEDNTKLTAVKFRRAIRKDVKDYNPNTLGEFRLIPLDNLRNSMLDRFEKNGVKYGNTIYNDLRSQIKEKRFNPLFSSSWSRFVRTNYGQRLGSLIASLQGTIVDEVSREVNKALEEGEDVLTTSQAINKVVNSNSFYMWQAERIARTEVGSAMNQASQVAVDKLGIDTVKRWVSGMDGRERESHRMANGQTRKQGEPFSNGLLYPHAPGSPASEVVNCRCVVQYIPE